jgi:hypothetical protein
LERAIAGVPYSIAPEREAELSELSAQHKFEIELSDAKGFAIGVVIETGLIRAPIAALEFLWATAYTHYVLYSEYADAQHAGMTQVKLGSSERSEKALRLFNWANANMRRTATETWPSDLPRPEAAPEPRSDIHVANEAFLIALAFIMHHEIAHVRLQHPPVAMFNALQEEREADRAATKWVIEGAGTPAELDKRLFGIAIAILALNAEETFTTRSIARTTHPHAFERLDECLTAAGVPEDHKVYAFAACLLQLHLNHSGVKASEEALNAPSFGAVFSELLFQLSRNKRA